MTEIQNLKQKNNRFETVWNLEFETCPLVAQAASPCPSAIGFASGECRAGLAGGRACNGRRVYL